MKIAVYYDYEALYVFDTKDEKHLDHMCFLLDAHDRRYEFAIVHGPTVPLYFDVDPMDRVEFWRKDGYVHGANRIRPDENPAPLPESEYHYGRRYVTNDIGPVERAAKKLFNKALIGIGELFETAGHRIRGSARQLPY